MATSKAQKAATAARRTQAIALRLAGADWTTIATALQYADRGAACKDVTRALEKYVAEQRVGLAELRELEVQRLDRLQRGLWSEAVSGNPKAIDAVLRIIDRRAKLLGLDAPVKVQTDGVVRYEIAGVDLEQMR